jgi:hypothetical protein
MTEAKDLPRAASTDDATHTTTFHGKPFREQDIE